MIREADMQKKDTREAVFAGSWYPAGAADCEREINSFLAEGDFPPPRLEKMIGGIVPHAGWHFSGSIAAKVIRCLQPSPPPEVVLLFGMHLGANAPFVMMPEGAWDTPFGELPVDSDLAAELVQLADFQLETPRTFNQDNTIELQLPFIKYFWPESKLVAIGTPADRRAIDFGRAAADAVQRMGRRVRVVGSTDLTHYGYNYGFTTRGTGAVAVQWVKEENDRRVIEAMLEMDAERVLMEARENRNACCAGAAAAALSAARRLGAAEARTVAYATSYDKSPGDSFVGYVGLVF
jgi:AmmeMemoRadiSam system protein B